MRARQTAPAGWRVSSRGGCERSVRRPAEDPISRLRWALWALVPVAAAAAFGLYFAFRSTEASAPGAGAAIETWGAGELKAPDFRLTDQYGKPVSIAAQRGRTVILTFVDPHCTTFCPRESIVLNDAIARLPAARPAGDPRRQCEPTGERAGSAAQGGAAVQVAAAVALGDRPGRPGSGRYGATTTSR